MNDEPAMPPQGTKSYTVTESDLVDLEKILPDVFWGMLPLMVNEEFARRLRVKWRRVQSIVSDIRWGNGPPSEVGIISAGDDR